MNCPTRILDDIAKSTNMAVFMIFFMHTACEGFCPNMAMMNILVTFMTSSEREGRFLKTVLCERIERSEGFFSNKCANKKKPKQSENTDHHFHISVHVKLIAEQKMLFYMA